MNDPRPSAPATISVWSDHALVYERLESQIESAFGTKARVVPGASHGAACDCSIHIIDSTPGFLMLIVDLHERFPEVPILAVAVEWSGKSGLEAARAGAKGLLQYRDIELRALSAISSLIGGDYWIQRPILSEIITSVLGNPRAGHKPSQV